VLTATISLNVRGTPSCRQAIYRQADAVREKQEFDKNQVTRLFLSQKGEGGGVTILSNSIPFKLIKTNSFYFKNVPETRRWDNYYNKYPKETTCSELLVTEKKLWFTVVGSLTCICTILLSLFLSR
jgi:hypothetical protein